MARQGCFNVVSLPPAAVGCYSSNIGDLVQECLSYLLVHCRDRLWIVPWHMTKLALWRGWRLVCNFFFDRRVTVHVQKCAENISFVEFSDLVHMDLQLAEGARMCASSQEDQIHSEGAMSFQCYIFWHGSFSLACSSRAAWCRDEAGSSHWRMPLARSSFRRSSHENLHCLHKYKVHNIGPSFDQVFSVRLTCLESFLLQSCYMFGICFATITAPSLRSTGKPHGPAADCASRVCWRTTNV